MGGGQGSGIGGRKGPRRRGKDVSGSGGRADEMTDERVFRKMQGGRKENRK